jgi:uncharacterized membrane protein (Fun14 family)
MNSEAIQQTGATVANTNTNLSELPYLTMGASFLIGLAIGYVIKKSFKLMLFLLGISLILIFFLEYKHIVTVNEDQLLGMVDSMSAAFSQFVIFLKERISQIKVSGTLSAVAGFLIGIKMG